MYSAMKYLSSLLFLTICTPFSCGISFSNVYLKYFKRRAIDIIDKAIPKDDCSRHLKAWVGDLFNLKKLWALQMLDASAKLQTGILTGNIMHWGNYDQCLQISEDKGNDGVIEGQYCTVVLLPVKNASSDIAQFLDFATFVPDVLGIEDGKQLKHVLALFKVLYGVCLPKSCSAENIQKLWDYFEYTFRLPVRVSIEASFCSSKGKVPYTFDFDKYVIWAFGALCLFTCLATIYDMIYQTVEDFDSNIYEKIFTSFSLHKNLKGIFHYPPVGTNNILSCLNGLKVLSMFWIIFGHRYLFGYITGTINMIDYFEWRKSLGALIVLLVPFAVDTFLTISGLLLSYKYLEVRDMLPNKSFPYLKYYLLRFLRLWPALIATILFYTSIMKYLNSGPLWTMTMYKMSLTCAHTGWLSALFLTNMVEFKHQCLEPAWYLAVDTQLYCIAPVLLYLLNRHPKRATFICLNVSLLSCLYAYIVTVNTKVKWSLSDVDERYHMKLYQSTFVRMPSWIFGLLTGTLLFNFQQIRIPKTLGALIWMVIILLGLGIAKATNVMTSVPYNEYSAALYNAVARLAWSLAICLLIFLCAIGHGGVINKILSLNIYSVIVKFSYSIFLLHVGVITVVGGNKRATTFHNSFTTLHAYLGDLPFILIASLFWCLVFESPFINIAKILIQSGNSLKAVAANDKKQLRKTVWESEDIVQYCSRDKQCTTRKNKLH